MIALWIALGLFAAVILLSVAGAVYLIFDSFTRTKTAAENFDRYCKRLAEEGKVEISEKLSGGKKAMEAEPHEDVWIMSKDAKKLHGIVIEPDPDAKKTAILVHGYRGQGGSDFSVIWRYYKERGYRILVIDQRTHGQSEGRFITFGKKERHDVANWVEYVKSMYGEDQRIVLHGVSMGAATVMLSQALPDNRGRLSAVVADCGYVSPKQQFSHMFKQMKLPYFPLFHIANFVCRIVCGYWFGEIHCGKALAEAEVPVLLIHGESDNFVPTECSRINFGFAKEPKTLYLVPGAAHATAALTDTEGYFRQLDLLLENIS